MKKEHNYTRRLPLHIPATMIIIGVLASAPLVAQTIDKTVKVGANVYQIALDPSKNTLYVASVGKSIGRGDEPAQILMLDAATLERKGVIDVASTPVFGLEINNKTQMLYGTNTLDGNVVVINLASGKVVATVGSGGDAHLRELRVDEQANRVYVSVVGTEGEKGNEVWVIDGASNTLERRIPVKTNTLTGIALDVAGKRIFATGIAAHEVAVIEIASGQTVAHWPSGGERPTNAVFDAATGRLFVTNQATGTLAVLDATKDGRLIKSIKTGERALDVKFDGDHGRVYVTNRDSGTVTVIDAKTYEVLAQLKTGTYPQTIAIDSKANRVFVSNKALTLGRDAPPDAVPPADPRGDTVAVIRF